MSDDAKKEFGMGLHQLAEMINKTPLKNPNPVIHTPFEKEECACSLANPEGGKRLRHMHEMRRVPVGSIILQDNVCFGCEHIWNQYATFLCAKCARTLARVEPARDKTGFTLEAGRFYYVQSCPTCDPEAFKNGFSEGVILDKVAWDAIRLGRKM